MLKSAISDGGKGVLYSIYPMVLQQKGSQITGTITHNGPVKGSLTGAAVTLITIQAKMAGINIVYKGTFEDADTMQGLVRAADGRTGSWYAKRKMIHADAIHDAAEKGDLERVEALLKGNPELAFSKDDLYNETPLLAAAENGNMKVAALLLSYKADVNAKNGLGQTALHSAAVSNQKDMVQLLLANNADVNVKDNRGETPLYAAAEAGDKDIVALLLANRADVNVKNNQGKTPLEAAEAKGHQEVAELLRLRQRSGQ